MEVEFTIRRMGGMRCALDGVSIIQTIIDASGAQVTSSNFDGDRSCEISGKVPAHKASRLFQLIDEIEFST